MSWITILEIGAILISCLITVFLLHSTYNNRHAPGAIPFSWLMVLNISWLLSSISPVSSTQPYSISPVFKLSFIFIAFIPVVFFNFSIQFTRHQNQINYRNTLLLSIVPLLTQVVVWTNEHHQLMWTSFELTRHGILSSVLFSYGPWFWIHTFYSYFLIIFSLVLLVSKSTRSSYLSRKQNLLIFLGISIPFVFNIVYVFGFFPELEIDLTPICFALLSPVIGSGLMRLRTFALMPIRRSELIEGISDGILVIDHMDRIIDINPAACRIFDLDEKESIGKEILKDIPVFESWLDFDEIKTWQQPQFQYSISGIPHYFSLRMSKLTNRKDEVIGRLIIVRNITRLKESELAEREARRIAENRSSELEVLNKFAGTLNHASTLHEVTTSSFQIILNHVKADSAWLILTRHLAPPTLTAIQTHKGPLDPSTFDTNLCESCPSLELVFSKKPSILEINECPLLARIYQNTENNVQQLCIPLRIGDRVIGSLHLCFQESIQFEITRRNFYNTIARQLSAAVERTILFEDIQKLAITDPLTGLFNRRHLFYMAEREINRAVRMNRPLAVIMMDLDHFKQINDLYGHMTGDRILKELAQRCQEGLRQVDLLARYGGEEFIFLLPECDFDRAVQVAERLRKSISETPFTTSSDLIWVTASFGVSAVEPGEETTLEKLIQEADISLYNAKATGRNNVKA